MNNIEREFSEKYLNNLLRGNKRECSAIVFQFLSTNNSINDLYEKVIKVALYEVGKLWEQNKISVAAEHIATAITESILNELFEQIISDKRVNKKVVLSCIENEKHQVGIKMVADIFEKHGWESYFLGPGIPIVELKKYIKKVNPDILAFSLSIYFNYQNLKRTLELITNDFPELLIIVGGQAFNHIEKTNFEKKDKIIYLSDLYILEKYIKSMNYNYEQKRIN